MENSILDYSSSSNLGTVFRAILIGLFSTIAFYTAIISVKALKNLENQRSSMVAYVSLCILTFCLGNFYLVTIIHLLNCYFPYPRPLHLILIYLPCTIFTMIVSRFCFLLIDIYITFNSESSPESKEKALELVRYCLFMYVAIDFTSRLMLSCLGNQSWMYKSSALETIMLLTLIFSVSSLLMILLIILIVYLRVKSVLDFTLAQEVNGNLRFYAFSFTFIVICFWLSFLFCKYLFGIDETFK